MSSQDIKGAERAAKAFVREMTPNDKAAIIKFGSTVAVVQHLTSDTTQLINAIEAPSPVTGMTALLDAIYQGVSEVLNETGRKMVIVYTDGWENSSYNSLPQIIEYAQRNNVPVYTIGYGDADIQTLMQIANMTGGEYHYSTDWAEIERIYATLGKLVKNFYVLAHATTDPNEDGSWRTVDITVNYFGITGQDTAHYRAPFKGIDLWVTQASFPDSVNKKGVISKYARPGETYFYTLTYGNDGSLPAQNVTIVNKLPAHITSVDSISPIPTSSNLDQIIWNIGEVPPRGSGTFTFSVTVDTLMPPYFVPLYDSVLITCIGDDVDSTNNIAVDTVFALPGVVPPPQIMVEPQVVFSLDSVKIKIWTSTPLNRWDIWIQYPDGTVDSSKYSGEISNFRQNRTPLMPDTPPLPDDWLVIEPSFHDTRKFTESDTEQYRAILHYEDYFNLQGEVSDTFWVKSNGLRPDLIARLEPLARDKSRSPGKPIDIRAYIKNMGGTDVTDSFVVAFSYANLDNIPLRWLVMERDTVVCSPQSPLLARSQDSILVTVSPSWVPPGMGNFRVYAYVDCDSQITEGHDVDTTFAFNNIDSTDVTVKIDSLIVNITQISRSDTIGRDNVIGGFPSYIFSYLTVTDQNNNPIKGLADSIKWLGSNDTTGTGDLVSSLWQPLVEYYRDDRNRPVLQDLYQMQPSIQITEVTETQSATLSFARMSVALVMDYSGNMSHQDIDEAKQAAKAFVQQMVPADKVAVLKYASTVAVVQSLTSDRTAIYNAIDTEPQLGTGTALLDAIHRAVTELLHESGRKMVLIFSAGPDNSSYNTVPYTIEYVQRSNIPVFTIGYGSANVSVLKTIANMTGGQYYYSKSWGEIEEICSTIANTLKSFYILGHATTDPDENGTWRTVDVTLNYAGVKGQDVGYYLAPYAGRDMRITETSYPDSINTEAKLAKYVKPGETFSYVLIYENIGNLPAQKVRIVKFLPDSVTVTGNFNHAPDIQTQEQLVWE
ncbi:MAG: VWA domain-containing protein, partial [candidate division KSB1 bacterium]|nr:VWA domain-containing protein [candidate division KSB1 bacterium]